MSMTDPIADFLTRIRNAILANQKIVETNLFDDVYIFPDAGDSGLTAGAALYEYYKNNRQLLQSSQNLSAHKQSAKMGIIRLLKYLS